LSLLLFPILILLPRKNEGRDFDLKKLAIVGYLLLYPLSFVCSKFHLLPRFLHRLCQRASLILNTSISHDFFSTPSFRGASRRQKLENLTRASYFLDEVFKILVVKLSMLRKSIVEELTFFKSFIVEQSSKFKYFELDLQAKC
jgi:hypothetical protein